MYIDLEHKFARVNLKLHGFDKCNQTKITGARMMLYTEDKYSSRQFFQILKALR